MSPLEQRVADLERKIEEMRLAKDRIFIEEMRRKLAQFSISIEDGASAAGTTVAVRDATDIGTETVADDYTGVATLSINGIVLGRIGYY